MGNIRCSALRHAFRRVRRSTSTDGSTRATPDAPSTVSASELPVKSGTCWQLIEIPVFVRSLNVLIGFCAELL